MIGNLSYILDPTPLLYQEGECNPKKEGPCSSNKRKLVAGTRPEKLLWTESPIPLLPFHAFLVHNNLPHLSLAAVS